MVAVLLPAKTKRRTGMVEQPSGASGLQADALMFQLISEIPFHAKTEEQENAFQTSPEEQGRE